VLFYALTYLVMFAIPIAGLRGSGPRPPLWVRAAAASGFLMTLLYVGLSVVPIVPVGSRVTFALKIVTVIGGANLLGTALFMTRSRT
jgi:hypothetical protein